MNLTRTSRPLSPTAAVNAAAVAFGMALLALAGPAAAQYKVVNPDGSVTYTDRPPSAATNARVVQLGRAGAAASPADSEPTLPPELRQATQRFPVTLYTAPDCPPCDNGRQYLQRRGIPYIERRAESDDDAVVLERIVGGRTVPALTVGSQPLRGYSETDWSAYLDAAGYPRESRLPRGWPTPAATPLVARVAPQSRPAAPPVPAAAAVPPAEEAPAPNPAGVRF